MAPEHRRTNTQIIAITLLYILFQTVAGNCNAMANYLPSPDYKVRGKVVYFSPDYGPLTKPEVVVQGADAATFKIIDNSLFFHQYGKDTHHVFFQGQAIKGADPVTFKIAYFGQRYSKDKHAVYYESTRLTRRVNQFHLLADNYAIYATDGVKFFCNSRIIAAPGFTLFWHSANSSRPSATGYAKNNTGVYHYCEPMPDADPESFNATTNTRGLAMDHDHVFFNGKLIPHADPASFVPMPRTGFGNSGLSDFFFKDKRAVYFMDKELSGISPESVREYPGDYLVDEDSVYKFYYEDQIRKLDGRDPGTFQAFYTGAWSKDKDGVYCNDNLQPSIDPATFEPAPDSTWQDKSARYGVNCVKICAFFASNPSNLPVCSSASPQQPPGHSS